MTEAMTTEAPPAGAQRGLYRTVDASALATLEQLQASQALGEGQVNLIGLDAIAERLGRGWAGQRDLVHEHLERNLHQWLDDQGVCQRISETDILVVQPGVGRMAAQALCLDAMRETTRRFLGAAAPRDLVLHEVTRIGAEGVYGERVDVGAVEAAAGEPDESAGFSSVGAWTPFVAADGRRVRVSCQLEPVIQLKASQRIGYRLVRRVLRLPAETPLSPAERRNMARADIERVDFATLSRGLGRLRADAAREPTLILPVSYTTLASLGARANIVDFFRQAGETVRHGLICEVCDIEGVPPSALMAATALIRPHCMFAVGQLTEAPTGSLRGLRDGGLQGISIECPPGIAGEAEFIGWTRALVAAAHPSIKSIIVYGLASLRQAAVAGTLGVTHGSLRGAG